MESKDVYSLLSLLGDCILVGAVNDENESWYEEFRWTLDSVAMINAMLKKYNSKIKLGYDEENERILIFNIQDIPLILTISIIKEILICSTRYRNYPDIYKRINQIAEKYGITVTELEPDEEGFAIAFEIDDNGKSFYFDPINEIGKKL